MLRVTQLDASSTSASVVTKSRSQSQTRRSSRKIERTGTREGQKRGQDKERQRTDEDKDKDAQSARPCCPRREENKQTYRTCVSRIVKYIKTSAFVSSSVIHFHSVFPHTMFVICATVFLLLLGECRGSLSSSYSRCANDTNDLATRVKGSSIVVFGTTMGKQLNEGSDTTFYVQFRVDCILKGPLISRMINITEAGYSSNRKYCQDFHMGRGYSIAFLERRPLYENDSAVFIPADFAEMPYFDNKTDEVLAEICDLHQFAPLESTSRAASVCPVVSTAPQCYRPLNTTTTASNALQIRPFPLALSTCRSFRSP